MNEPALGPGSSGPEVEELQARLALHLEQPPKASGVYDRETASAVAEFQRAAGLAPDGMVGPATWAALADADASAPWLHEQAEQKVASKVAPPVEEAEPEQAETEEAEPAKSTAAPTLLDRPAVQDELGRRAFAVALAARIVQLRGTYEPRERAARVRLSLRIAAARFRARFRGGPARAGRPDGPFLVHLHGTWGSGKTSLLNFFAEQLERPGDEVHEAVWGPDFASQARVRPWIVVTFNAWQHQRVAPPWWWLMNAVSNQAARHLPLHRRMLFRLRDHAWRVRCRWPAIVVPAVGLVAIASSVWLVATKTTWFDIGEGETWYAHVGAIASGLGAVVAFALTLWSGVGAVRRWVLVGSARGAETFLTTASDPMAFVQKRYDHLVRTLGRPLAVIIDDLDRCKSEHVVQLLEGVHTLFAGTAATYVVAADHAWLRECFALEYEAFARADGDPGRPLGYRFLEKTFQLATSLPRLDPDTRKRYLETLLRPNDAGTEREHQEEARRAARAQARSLASEQEIRAAYEQSLAKSSVQREAIREALVLRAAARDIQQQTEYLLSDFVHLLEPNPRSMKRLVNAYGFAVKLQLLEQETLESDLDATRRLALWTIAGLRWPTLTDLLVRRPELADGSSATGTVRTGSQRGYGRFSRTATSAASSRGRASASGSIPSRYAGSRGFRRSDGRNPAAGASGGHDRREAHPHRLARPQRCPRRTVRGGGRGAGSRPARAGAARRPLARLRVRRRAAGSPEPAEDPETSGWNARGRTGCPGRTSSPPATS